MYEKLRHAFAKIGLPRTFSDLDSIGVKTEHLVSAGRIFANDSLYGRLFNKDGASPLTAVFATSSS